METTQTKAPRKRSSKAADLYEVDSKRSVGFDELLGELSVKKEPQGDELSPKPNSPENAGEPLKDSAGGDTSPGELRVSEGGSLVNVTSSHKAQAKFLLMMFDKLIAQIGAMFTGKDPDRYRHPLYDTKHDRYNLPPIDEEELDIAAQVLAKYGGELPVEWQLGIILLTLCVSSGAVIYQDYRLNKQAPLKESEPKDVELIESDLEDPKPRKERAKKPEKPLKENSGE